ncbi:GAP family protein [Salinispora oceanensis]|uniref:GAP family protein n=1 Tax=Salinispora oceanensis TaxID=1050199 RepID=UPI00035F1112|nr:GAP family protein [Salinispora oceanensis]
MDLALIGSLVVLALIDSTSFGTLLIPIWMMLAPGRLRPSRLLVFLATVAACYLVLGVVLLVGAAALLDEVRPVLETTPFRVVQLAVGIGLVGLGLVIGWKRGSAEPQPGRLLRWRERAMGGRESTPALVGLALAAVTLEATTMLPYLAAIGLLGASALTLPASVAVLAGYCVVMVLPALVLLAARLVAAGLVQPVLAAVNRWMVRHAAETTGWIVGIIGILLARDAANHLELFAALSRAT